MISKNDENLNKLLSLFREQPDFGKYEDQDQVDKATVLEILKLQKYIVGELGLLNILKLMEEGLIYAHLDHLNKIIVSNNVVY